MWQIVNRGNQEARAVADRHYNRQSHGSPFFVPPGECLVLLSDDKQAVWVTSRQKFSKHAWKGALVNSLFRNESSYKSSSLIREAVELTQRQFGPLPIITFIDSTKVKTPIRAIGWCYRKAGFKPIGFTKRGLHVFEFQGVLV